MERLVFNAKEHKLEELEKYGFDYYENEMFQQPYWTNSYIHIWVKDYNVEVYYLNSVVTTAVIDLYDLIKHGLIIKEEI